MRIAFWFRSDLRIKDNLALETACQKATDGVLALFFWSFQQWKEHDWADVKIDFLRRNLEKLQESLEALHIPLGLYRVSFFKEIPEVLEEVLHQYRCHALYFNQEYEVHEQKRDQEVEQRLKKRGYDVSRFQDQRILAPETLRKKDGGVYTVYTPFKKNWLRQVELQKIPSKKEVSVQKPLPLLFSVPTRVFLEEEKKKSKSESRFLSELWPAGERVALQALDFFIDKKILHYHEKRDFPALEGTSCLSPYLALGVISPYSCFQKALEQLPKKEESVGRRIWVDELIWREFYRYILVAFPRVSKNRAFRENTEGIPWREDREQFERWCQGETGIPLIDAAMRQLRVTGWMHNRLRMLTATFLTKNLLISWRWGERFFMQNLVDGDLANNNGGWQWSASTGTDALPYFRVFNPYHQSKKYDPEGVFIRKYVPELESLSIQEIHDPKKCSLILRRTGLKYPQAMVDCQETRKRALEIFRKSLKKSKKV
jgi:deoxyribodipyrimidine photo-lyase